MTQGRDTGKMRHQENREVGIGEHGGSRGKERKRWQLRRSTTIFAIWASHPHIQVNWKIFFVPKTALFSVRSL